MTSSRRSNSPNHAEFFQLSSVGQVHVVKIMVPRLFDPAVIERIAVALNELLVTHSQVVIDLSHVQFISSAMLGRLVMAWMEMTKRGGKFVLCGASETISEIFHLAGLNHRVQMYPDCATAVTVISGEVS